MNLNSLIDQAVEQMPWARRRIVQRLLRNPQARAIVVDTLAANLAEHDDWKLLADFDSKTFSGTTSMAIDPANLKAILDFIMQILPIILKIFIHV